MFNFLDIIAALSTSHSVSCQIQLRLDIHTTERLEGDRMTRHDGDAVRPVCGCAFSLFFKPYSSNILPNLWENNMQTIVADIVFLAKWSIFLKEN